MTPHDRLTCQWTLHASQPDWITIFLDIDGVLHPANCSPSPSDFKPPKSPCVSPQSFSQLAAFEYLLRRHSNTYVVISSAWRMYLGLSELRRFFSADIQPRIIGITPHIRLAEDREIEIGSFMSQATRAGYRGRFLVIDDYSPYFRDKHLLSPSLLISGDWGTLREPAPTPYLYLVDGQSGLTTTDITTLDVIMHSVKSPLTDVGEHHLKKLWPQSMNAHYGSQTPWISLP